MTVVQGFTVDSACGRQQARARDTLRRKHSTTPKTITIKGTPMASTRYKLSRIYRTYCTRSLRARMHERTGGTKGGLGVAEPVGHAGRGAPGSGRARRCWEGGVDWRRRRAVTQNLFWAKMNNENGRTEGTRRSERLCTGGAECRGRHTASWRAGPGALSPTTNNQQG